MNERIYLGPVPAFEPCAQLGQEGYDVVGRAEAEAHVAQLYRFLASRKVKLPTGLKIRVTEEPHDFGTYFEVVCTFLNDPESWKIATLLDNERPTQWDDESKETLKASEASLL